jgi:hypothetical protein
LPLQLSRADRAADLVPIWHRLRRHPIRDLEPERHPDPCVRVSRQRGVHLFAERTRDRHHVLHGRDAVHEAVGRSEKRPQPHVGGGRRRVVAGSAVEAPDVEGHLLEKPAQEHVVRMIVRVDKAGNHQMAGRVDRRRRIVHGDVRADLDDAAAPDEDIRDRRLVNVAVEIEDPPAPDEKVPRRAHAATPKSRPSPRVSSRSPAWRRQAQAMA